MTKPALPSPESRHKLAGWAHETRAVGIRVRAAAQTSQSQDGDLRAMLEASVDAIFLTRSDGTITDANAAACALLDMTKEEICRAGRSGLMRGEPDLDGAIQTQKEAGSAKAEIVMTRKNGAAFPAEVVSTLVNGAASDARALVIVRDITEFKKAQAAQRTALARSTRMVKASEDILAAATTETVLQIAVDAARDLTNASKAVAGYDYEAGTCRLSVASGADDALCANAQALHNRPGAYIELIESTQTIRFTDSEMRSHPRLRGLVGARLAGTEGHIGVLVASDRTDGSDFSDYEEAQLAQLASMASLRLKHIEVVAQAEARAKDLYESEEHLRLGAEAASLGTYRYNHATQIGNYSSEFLALFGLRPDEQLVLGADYAPNAILDTDRTRFLEAMAASNDPTGDGLLQAEYRIARPDGSIRWLQVRGRTSFAITPAGKYPDRSTGVIMDITSQKSLEQEREQEAAKLEAAVSVMAAGLIICARDGRIVHANEAAKRIFGLTPETMDLPLEQRVAGCSFETPDGGLIQPDRLPIYRALMAGESVVGEAIGLRQGTVVTWLSCGAAPVRDAKGEQIGAVLSFSDITDLKQAKRDLSKMLADRAEFVAMCSHELKTPLTVLLANVELFQQKFDNLDKTRRAKLLASMLSQIRKLDRLVIDLLEVSRMEMGLFALHQTSTPLHHLVGRIAADFGTTCLTHRIATDIPVECVSLVDRVRLELMLLNLLTNATKFSEEGTTISVSMRIQDDYAEILVTDEGCGIPEAAIAQVFERHYRPLSTGIAAGLGMDLAMTRELALLHGGSLSVESTEGVGSTFTLCLPLSPASAALAGPVGQKLVIAPI